MVAIRHVQEISEISRDAKVCEPSPFALRLPLD